MCVGDRGGRGSYIERDFNIKIITQKGSNAGLGIDISYNSGIDR